MLEDWDDLTHVVVVDEPFYVTFVPVLGKSVSQGVEKRMFYIHAILPPLDLDNENRAPSRSGPDYSLSHVILDHIFLSHYVQESD